MNSQHAVKISSYLFVLILFIFGCKGDETVSRQDITDISEEAVTDAYFQDMDDLAGVAIAAPTSDQYNNGGRTATTITIDDGRICNSAVVTLTKSDGSTIDNPKGIISVDFGSTGCKDSKGYTRTGKIMFAYSGKRFQPNSTVVTTVDNYAINGIKIGGTRTVTNTASSSVTIPTFNIVLQNGMATFTDNTIAQRESNITVRWVISNPADTQLIVDASSTASGTTRGGRTYSVSLLKDLVYKRFCPIAVEGIKKYKIGNSPDIQVDYGSGTCDNSVVVTVGNISKTVQVSGKF
jgi:hypothetical protein